ncbi:MAG TPA: Zn-dependent alcohol dehydrogenase [Alphaproteobacteria bacterium]|nr:Zn-dependent alcohol dehydrogenase [Alphaproteobacteria bacterium]
MKFNAAVLHQVHKPLTIERVEADLRAPDDVAVRIRATSLCHTDLEVIEGQLAYPLPIVLGHEAAGTVEAVGPAVTGLASGDHVILSWNPHCGHCFYCSQDEPILCETYLGLGPQAVPFDGVPRLSLDGRPLHHMFYLASFAEYAIVPAQSAIKVPAEIPFDRACLIGCGVMTGAGAALKVTRPAPGAAVAVLGCGGVGLSAVQGARIAGAGAVVAIDPVAAKRELAVKLGASHAIDPQQEDAVREVKRLTGGRGADVVIEAAGTDAAFRLSVEVARPGAQVAWLGKVNVEREVAFRWGSLMGEKRIVRSSYGGARPSVDFPALGRLYLDGRLQLDPYISRRIALAEINDGFSALKRGEVIRSVITM